MKVKKNKIWKNGSVLIKNFKFPKVLAIFGLPKYNFWSDQKTGKLLYGELNTEHAKYIWLSDHLSRKMLFWVKYI